MKKKVLIKDISRLVSMDDKTGVIDNSAIIINDDKIEWVGSAKRIPKGKYKEISVGGALVLPGLIDCHTHIVHAGSRENEYELRAKGATYLEIAKSGGGIMSTVRATRQATKKQLTTLAINRLMEAKSFGTAFVEIKSGYGLSIKDEDKILKVIGELSSLSKKNSLPGVVGTFLGAHVVPSEFKNNRKEYLDLLITKMIPNASNHSCCKFLDIFVEDGAFSKDEAILIAKQARNFDLGIKLHVDQFTNIDGAKLSAQLDATSADHLDKSSDNGIKMMAKKGVVGVLLPGASMFTRQQLPNARRLIDLGLTVALSTDYNPGTSPTLNLVYVAALGIMQMGMTVDEAWRSITLNAAKALKLDSVMGSVTTGKLANLTVFDCKDEAFPFYRYTTNLVKKVFINGK